MCDSGVGPRSYSNQFVQQERLWKCKFQLLQIGRLDPLGHPLLQNNFRMVLLVQPVKIYTNISRVYFSVKQLQINYIIF